MARKMDVDWSDWKGVAEAPEHPLSQPIAAGTKGIDVVANINNLVKSVIIDAKKMQPTKDQFEAAIASKLPSKETIAKAEKDWQNRFTNHFAGANMKIDHLNKGNIDDSTWDVGKSFNSLLSKEEVEERNKYLGND